MSRNVRLYPWFKFCNSLTFWQAVWFLYFQQELSAAEAILLYAAYDLATTALEVPSGYLSDRIGRRITLVLSMATSAAGTMLFVVGEGFEAFLLGQVLLGAGMAFGSGTDSALLYESLARDGKESEIERHELTAWRFQFTALALSAVTGGLMAAWVGWAPFLFGALALVAALGIALAFREPPHDAACDGPGPGILAAMGGYLRSPVLLWLFVLAVVMYGFSHVPFVFGQPFIQEALAAEGIDADAAIVSGAVSALMMLVSVGASWLAPFVRRAIGVAGILLLALGMQVGLIAVLAATGSVLAVGLLLLRMVPDSFARPVMLAQVQPLLDDSSRATYLSLQSFMGRLAYAASLIVLSAGASDIGALPHGEISAILVWYVGAGVVVLLGLVAASRALRQVR